MKMPAVRKPRNTPKPKKPVLSPAETKRILAGPVLLRTDYYLKYRSDFFICPSCKAPSSRSDVATIHFKRTHTPKGGASPLTCPLTSCKKSFNNRADFHAHLRYHDQILRLDKPFPCTCGKAFVTNNQLSSHTAYYRRKGIPGHARKYPATQDQDPDCPEPADAALDKPVSPSQAQATPEPALPPFPEAAQLAAMQPAQCLPPLTSTPKAPKIPPPTLLSPLSPPRPRQVVLDPEAISEFLTQAPTQHLADLTSNDQVDMDMDENSL